MPVHDCDTWAWPIDAADPNTTPSGASTLELRDELQSVLDSRLATGTWSDGTTTTVTARLGEPSAICRSNHGTGTALKYTLPLALDSADGRMELARPAHVHSVFDVTGAWVSSVIEVYESELTPW